MSQFFFSWMRLVRPSFCFCFFLFLCAYSELFLGAEEEEVVLSDVDEGLSVPAGASGLLVVSEGEFSLIVMLSECIR